MEIDYKTLAAKISQSENRAETISILTLSTGLEKHDIRKIAIDEGVLKQWSDENVISEYKKGLTDKEIGNIFGFDAKVIARWRNKKGLDFNKALPKVKSRPSRTQIDYAKAKKLYDEGKSDGAIAIVFGVSSNTIWNWRRKNNLPPNSFRHEKKPKPEEIPEPHSKQDPIKETPHVAEKISRLPDSDPIADPTPSRCACCKAPLELNAYGLQIYMVINIGGKKYEICSDCADAIVWAAKIKAGTQ